MKTILHSRLPWFAAFAVAIMAATALLAAVFTEDTTVEDIFDRGLYEFYLSIRVDSGADIVADYEWHQIMFMPLVLPDAEHVLTHTGGWLPVTDWAGISKDFIAGLVPVERDGVTYWPVWVMEDADTTPRRRLILNAKDEIIAEIPVPKDYDPAWWVKQHYPQMYDGTATAGDEEYRKRLEALFDGSRLVMQYDLIDGDNLVKLVLQQSVAAALRAEEEEEGGGMMMMDWGGGSVTNVQFVAIEPDPATNGIVLGIAYPDDMTNTALSIFACTNLMDSDWTLIAVTNTSASTNFVEYLDTDATNYTVRFYRAACFAGSLHPQASDFENGKAGRVMISTLHDDFYYTATDTTMANEPAQTEDGKVTITAHLPRFCEGKTVYFRVVTPDPDDASSYETNSIGGDNRDTNVVAGVLSASNDMAEIETINGQEVAAAEVELTITDRYAGDNYQVEYSLDSDFTRVLDQTVVMVAWKRIYIEEDQMYRSGSDLTADFVPDTNGLPDSVTVTEISKIGGLTLGDTVIIFDADKPAGESAIVTNIAGSTLFLDTDLTNSYVAGYGASGKGAAVALPRAGVYDASTASLTNAYGHNTEGTDGGCFVEFVMPETGCNTVPYKSALNVGFIYPHYSRVWFANGGKTNYTHLIGACTYLNVNGKTSEDINLCIICVGWIEAWNPQAAVVNADVTVHEFGHQFSLSPSQTDSYHPNVWCHLGADTDYCVMDYDRNRSDVTVEFCCEAPNHIYAIRDRSDDL